MNRGRLRRYALGVLAAASLGVTIFVTAGGVAHADTVTGDDSGTTTIARIIVPDAPPAAEAQPDDFGWA